MCFWFQLQFDKAYGGTWHCIVGRNFGCSVTHETKYLVFFKVRGEVNDINGEALAPSRSLHTLTR